MNDPADKPDQGAESSPKMPKPHPDRHEKIKPDYVQWYDNAPDMFVSVEAETGTIIHCNKTLARRLGYSRENIIGQSVFTLYHPDSHSSARRHFQTFESSGEIRDAELVLATRDGEKIPVSINVSAVRDESGNILYSRSVLRDISAYKQIEFRLRNLQNILLTIKDIHQLIASEKDRKTLFQKICKLLVKNEQYHFAWIGLIRDDNPRVEPIAWAGNEDGYLQSIIITWDDTDTGRGPTGTAIRTGKPVLMQDIANDPSYRPWRQEAQKRGYSSSVAVPLMHEGQARGALNVYATRSDVLNEDAIKLLMEVCQSLAFALFSIEQEERRREAEAFNRAVLKSVGEGIVVFNQDLRYVTWNSYMESLSGLKAESILGQYVFDVLPFLKKLGVENFLKRALKGETIIGPDRYFKIRQTKKEGWFVSTYAPHRNLAGRIDGVVVLVQDITKRKIAEQELVRSEEKYRQLIENANEAIFIVQNEKLVFANPMTNQISSYSNEELFRRPFFDFVHPEDRDGIYANYVKQLAGENASGNFIVRIIDKDNHVRWLSNRSIYIEWEGKPATLNFASDITDRRHIEEALIASEEKYRTLFEKSGDAILIIENGTFVECNQATVDMLGYNTKDELLQTHPSVLSPPTQPDGRDSVEKADEMMRMALEKGSHRFEWDHKRANGEVFPVEVLLTTISNEPGNQIIHTVWRDITDRKKAEQELLESERKFRELIEQSNDGIYILLDHRFVFINPRFTEITGYQLGEISGEDFDFMELVAEEGLDIFREREAIRSRGAEPPNRFVFTILRKDGEKRDMEASVTDIEWQGSPATLGILHDVTERVQTQHRLERALKKAKQGERVKNLFIANMSHEIRTPLNAILGFSALLKEKFRHLISEDEEQFFTAIDSGSKRLMRTVHEILDISQIEAGAYAIQKETLDLTTLAKGLVFDHQLAARNKNLALTYESDLETAFIHADKYSITQAISNILDNAIKYTHRGHIDVGLTEKGKQYVLTISDTGIGIDNKYIHVLFEAFTQESEGYTKKFQGIGLGMAITKRHLDLNRVKIEVASTKGVGTTFTLTFRANRAPSRVKVAKQSVTVDATEKTEKMARLLVVEDDPHSQDLIKFFLRGQCENFFAESVAGAKQTLKSNTIDLILLDLSLIGKEDGLDLVRWMRKTKTWGKIPVIATTAHALTTDRDNCLAAGCNDYLSKPISREKLLTKIRQFV